MRQLVSTVALVAAITLPATSSAQDGRPVQFGVSAGLTMPMGDIGDLYSSGFNVAGHVWFLPATMPNLSFRGDVAFDRLSAKESELEGAVNRDGSFTSIGVTGNVVFSFSQEDPSSFIRPYLLAGIGMFNTKSSLTTSIGEAEVTQSVSDTNFGFQAGGGINFNLSGFQTFAEAKFVNVSAEGGSARWIPISFGVRF